VRTMQTNFYSKTLSFPFLFDVPDVTREDALREEIAAVSCLAFCERRRIGIIGGRTEKVKAILKIYYPLIYTPWKKRCFIIDGLGFLGFAFSDLTIPDILQFTESLKKSSVLLKDFMETLDYGTRLFSDITKSAPKDYRIDYLIGERNLLEILSSLSNKSALINLMEEEKPKMIQPRLQATHVKNVVESISQILIRLSAEVNMLRYAQKVLESEVSSHLEMLSRESSLVLREYRRKEKEVDIEINEKIRCFNEEKLKEINEVRREYNRKIRVLLKEREKAEKALLKNKILLEKQLKMRSYGKNKYSKKKVDLHLSRIEELTRRIKEIEKAIEEIEAEESNKIRDIEKKYEMLIINEKEKIEVLKESRDADISRINEDIKKIREAYLDIKENIMRIISGKEMLIKSIENCLFPIKVDEITIIGIPFYVVIYEGQEESRLNLYPPIGLRCSAEMVKDILKHNLKQRMTRLLEPFKKYWSGILNVLVENLDKDAYLSGEVKRILNEGNNILLSRNFMDILKNGLEKLKEDLWLNSQEENEIIDFYMRELKIENSELSG